MSLCLKNRLFFTDQDLNMETAFGFTVTVKTPEISAQELSLLNKFGECKKIMDQQAAFWMQTSSKTTVTAIQDV